MNRTWKPIHFFRAKYVSFRGEFRCVVFYIGGGEVKSFERGEDGDISFFVGEIQLYYSRS